MFVVWGNGSVPESSGDNERHVRPETWPNGSPMWATAPGSRIQLRMPPVPSYLRVLASRADSPEPVTSSGIPSVAQLRELGENSVAAPAQTVRPEQPLAAQVAARRLLANQRNLTVEYNRLAAAGVRYADDVYPAPDTFDPHRDDVSDNDSSESSTRFYDEGTITQEGDHSSDVVTDSTVEVNLDAEFYKQECDRLAALVANQNEALLKQEENLKRLELTGANNSTALAAQLTLNERMSDNSKAMQQLIDALQVASEVDRQVRCAQR